MKISDFGILPYGFQICKLERGCIDCLMYYICGFGWFNCGEIKSIDTEKYDLIICKVVITRWIIEELDKIDRVKIIKVERDAIYFNMNHKTVMVKIIDGKIKIFVDGKSTDFNLSDPAVLNNLKLKIGKIK